MKTLIVPKFKTVWPIEKKCHTYEFIGYAEVEIKDKPNSADYITVTNELPGMALGYCPEFYQITITHKPIPIINFYDIRQHGVNKLKNFRITLKN